MKNNIPDAAQIMEKHRRGFNPEKNIYSGIENHRPLLGAYTVSEYAADVMSGLRDFLDFGQENISAGGFEAYETAGLPWIGVWQPAIPLGRSDKTRWDKQADIAKRTDQLAESYNLMLGVNMGSEPHTSPGDYYTGQQPDEQRELGTLSRPDSAREFGLWMKEMYGSPLSPKTPGINGKSFYEDFGALYSAAADGAGLDWDSIQWEDLFIPRPKQWSNVYYHNTERGPSVWQEFTKYNPDEWLYCYLHSMFSQYCIEQAIKGTGENFDKSRAPYSGRLISWQGTPEYSVNMRQLQQLTTSVGVTYYTTGQDTHFGANPGERAYEPYITEYTGSLIYQQALKSGVPVIYNEFCLNMGLDKNKTAKNTIGNFYRGYFGEMQYKPAVITWFWYTGTGAGQFGAEELTPCEAWLAALRGQLEAGDIYNGINRPKSGLAVFIPDTNSYPAGLEYNVLNGRNELQKILSPQIMAHSPDIMLTNQIADKISEYDNIIIVLKSIDGSTDTFLCNYLKNIPPDKKIMIIPASRALYCEPGGRTSAKFYKSLHEVLPISPDGDYKLGGYSLTSNGTDTNYLSFPEPEKYNLNILGVPVTVYAPAANEIYINTEISKSGELIGENDSAGGIAWLAHKKNYLVLAGVPRTGLDGLINKFFGLTPPDLREAGSIKILNTHINSHTAEKEGWYSVDREQTLFIGGNLIGYDLTKRSAVNAGGAIGETVVRAVPKNGLSVLDAGIADIDLKELKPNYARIAARKPSYPFEFPDGKIIRPEITFYSSDKPKVTFTNNKTADIHVVGGGFYKINIDDTDWTEYIFRNG